MKSNLILIGFMGSGKSTVGKILAEKLEMKFLDTDLEIEKEQGRSVQDIFSEKGEEYFRKLENEMSKKLSTVFCKTKVVCQLSCEMFVSL